jgi:hypothetical protein
LTQDLSVDDVAREAVQLLADFTFTVNYRTSAVRSLEFGDQVTTAQLAYGILTIVAPEATIEIDNPIIHLSAYGYVDVLDAGGRVRIVGFEPDLDDASFIAALNALNVRRGYGPYKSPEEEHREALAEVAAPLAEETVGKTVAAVQAFGEINDLEGRPGGYTFVFTDGSQVALRAVDSDEENPYAVIAYSEEPDGD